MEKNNIPLVCVKTGVKNATPIAWKATIGSNDEPNGHGTIFVNWLDLNKLLKPHENMIETKKLRAFLELSNLYVGDAICNLLMCEGAMLDLDMNITDFKDIYTELPSHMFKCVVHDRKVFKPNENEMRLIEPESTQKMIDDFVSEFPGSRAFVRPSGTEDILRLYVEANNEDEID